MRAGAQRHGSRDRHNALILTRQINEGAHGHLTVGLPAAAADLSGFHQKGRGAVKSLRTALSAIVAIPLFRRAVNHHGFIELLGQMCIRDRAGGRPTGTARTPRR